MSVLISRTISLESSYLWHRSGTGRGKKQAFQGRSYLFLCLSQDSLLALCCIKIQLIIRCAQSPCPDAKKNDILGYKHLGMKTPKCSLQPYTLLSFYIGQFAVGKSQLWWFVIEGTAPLSVRNMEVWHLQCKKVLNTLLLARKVVVSV